MHRKYRRQLELGIVALALTSLLLLWLVIAIGFWQMAQAQDVTGRALSSQPQTLTDHRPDISHCFAPDETRELWDCIRHKEADNE